MNIVQPDFLESDTLLTDEEMAAWPGQEEFEASLRRLFKPSDHHSLSECADRWRYISPEVASEGEMGPWHTDRNPAMREPMDAFTDPDVREITLMKATRSGGTDSMIANAFMHIVLHDPAQTAIYFPSDTKAKQWSENTLDSMIRDIPTFGAKFTTQLTQLLERMGRREKGAEIRFKAFAGGFCILTTANSEHAFQNTTLRFEFMTDVDDLPMMVGESGDTISLGRNRLQNFKLTSKFVKEGKPKIEGSSMITREYEHGDRRHYTVVCPGCHEPRILLFSEKSYFRKNNYQPKLAAMFLHYDKEKVALKDPEGAWFVCETCGTVVYERGKLDWFRKTGRWVPERKDIVDLRSYHFPAWLSPWVTWTEIADEWIKANTVSLRQVCINSKFAEPFERDEGITVRTNTLMPFVEQYDKLPEGVVLLTAATDMQADWLKTEIVGWGLDGECWIWDVAMFEGRLSDLNVQKSLGDYLDITWPHELGFNMGVAVEVIDTHGKAGSTNYAYKFVRKRINEGHKCYGVRGKGGEGVRLLYAMSRKNEEHIPLWTLGVDSGKTDIMDRLKMMQSGKDKDGNERKEKGGANWIHFREKICDEEYFEELTAEIKRPVHDPKGFVKWVWVKKRDSQRNEILDITNYNFAAREMWKGNIDREARRLQELAEEFKREKPAADSKDKPTVSGIHMRARRIIRRR